MKGPGFLVESAKKARLMPPKPSTFTQAQGMKAVAWAKEKLGMQAWGITLTVDNERPEGADLGAIGFCAVVDVRKSADVWIGPEVIKADGSDILETLFHEMVHISLVEAGVIVDDHGWRIEHYCDLVADVMVEAYGR